MKIKLLADSGSTKTTWVMREGEVELFVVLTPGINPYMMTRDEIFDLLENESNLLSLKEKKFDLEFYGAGCRGDKLHFIRDVLRDFFGERNILVASDMLGAAKSLCGEEEGIVCILGTGSNSCLYDGKQIVENVSPLGFILGDEGSGAVLGKRLLGDILKKQMPETICADFFKEYSITTDNIIQRVYRESFPNRFLASFAPFLGSHRNNSFVHDLIVDEFIRFFNRNVRLYARPDLSVNFVGSIAYYFKEELEEAAHKCGFIIGRIKREPLREN